MSANGVKGESIDERAADYRRLYDAGVRAVRVDISWLDVEEPGEPLGDFKFTETDAEIEAIRQAGLKAIGILAYGHPDYSALGSAVAATPLSGGLPPFAIGGARAFPPDDPADFARYAHATAAHYGDEVLAWEVWNEQNEGWRFWAPREDPPAYARLLCEAYRAVKAADPGTPVLYGGVFFPALPGGVPGMSGPEFLQATYDADPQLGSCFDVMAYHPYPYPFTAPELDVPIRGSVLSAADQMRAVLARNGDADKPLWITEVGWPTNRRAYGVSEAKQAEYVARMQAATFAQGLPALTWYTAGDEADASGLNQEAAFGFLRADGSPKPAYQALSTFSRVFEGAQFETDRSSELGLPAGEPLTGGRAFALEYARGTTRITALWLAGESVAEAQGPFAAGAEETLEVRLPVSSPSVRLVDHLGGEQVAEAHDGEVVLELGPGPVYVVDGE